MSGRELSILIVSFNTRELTLRCVESVLRHGAAFDPEIVVVDNASSDGSAEALRERFPGIDVVAHGKNVGFAAGNNIGFRRCTGRFILLLNPDTEIYADTLQVTMDHIRRTPEAGVVACRSFRPDGTQQSTLIRVPTLGDVVINTFCPNFLMRRSRILGRARYVGIDLEREQDVEVVAGVFMLLRREVYEQVGGMDEDFFVYGEEIEWCHRIGAAGWRLRYVPGAKILHHGGVSTSQFPAEMNISMARGQVLVIRKVHGRFAERIAVLLMVLRDAPRALAHLLLRPFVRADAPGFAKGLRNSAHRFRWELGLVFGADPRA